jgi:hypothetical protein
MQPYHRFTLGAAWFFIVVSLMHLGWVAAVKVANPAGLAAVYQTTVDGEIYSALSYDGWFGVAQVLLQGFLVVTAAVLSVLPWNRGRRLGHSVLTVWAGFWAVSLLRLAGLEGGFDTICQAGVASVLFGATGYRTLCGWSRKRALAAEPVELDVPEFQPEPEPVMWADSDPEPDPDPKRSPKAAICCFGQAVKCKVCNAADRAKRAKPVVQNKARNAVRCSRRGAANVLGKVADFTSRQARRLSV